MLGFLEIMKILVYSSNRKTCIAFFTFVAKFHRNVQILFVVRGGALYVPIALYFIQGCKVTSVAKVSVRKPLSRSVSHLFANCKILAVVFFGLFKVPANLIQVEMGFTYSPLLSCCQSCFLHNRHAAFEVFFGLVIIVGKMALP